MQGRTLTAKVGSESDLETALQALVELAGHLEEQHSKGLAERLRQVVSAQSFPALPTRGPGRPPSSIRGSQRAGPADSAYFRHTVDANAPRRRGSAALPR